MLVPTFLLPHRALHYAKLADTGLGPTWDADGVTMRCRVSPKRRRRERDREGIGITQTTTDTATVQTSYPMLAVGDRVIWAGRTMVVLSVSDVPSPWGHTAWWDAELGEKP